MIIIVLPKSGSKPVVLINILLSIVNYLDKSVSKVLKGGILQI